MGSSNDTRTVHHVVMAEGYIVHGMRGSICHGHRTSWTAIIMITITAELYHFGNRWRRFINQKVPRVASDVNPLSSIDKHRSLIL